MSDHKGKPEKKVEAHKEEEPTGAGGNAFLEGLRALLGGAAHQPMKKISIFDPVKAMMRTALGSFAMAVGGTEIEIEFNETAANTTAEADRLAAQLEGEGEKLAREIEAGAEADVIRSKIQR